MLVYLIDYLLKTEKKCKSTVIYVILFIIVSDVNYVDYLITI